MNALDLAVKCMDAHKSFGYITENLHGNKIRVGASGFAGRAHISIRGETQNGTNIGGLFSPAQVRTLIGELEAAIEHAERVAA